MCHKQGKKSSPVPAVETVQKVKKATDRRTDSIIHPHLLCFPHNMNSLKLFVSMKFPLNKLILISEVFMSLRL